MRLLNVFPGQTSNHSGNGVGADAELLRHASLNTWSSRGAHGANCSNFGLSSFGSEVVFSTDWMCRTPSTSSVGHVPVVLGACSKLQMGRLDASHVSSIAGMQHAPAFNRIKRASIRETVGYAVGQLGRSARYANLAVTVGEPVPLPLQTAIRKAFGPVPKTRGDSVAGSGMPTSAGYGAKLLSVSSHSGRVSKQRFFAPGTWQRNHRPVSEIETTARAKQRPFALLFGREREVDSTGRALGMDHLSRHAELTATERAKPGSPTYPGYLGREALERNTAELTLKYNLTAHRNLLSDGYSPRTGLCRSGGVSYLPNYSRNKKGR